MRQPRLWIVLAAGSAIAAAPWLAPAAAQARPAAPAGAAAQAPLTQSQAAALSTDVTDPVIVVLKDQAPDQPATRADAGARSAHESSARAPIMSELQQTKAQKVHPYTVLDAISATVSPGEAARLKQNPQVDEVVPDGVIHLATPTAAQVASSAPAVDRTPLPGTCGTKNKPELEPEADSVIHAISADPSAKTAASLGIDGAGVTVGWIADGLDVDNPDFIRPDGSHVFTDYQDFSGFGVDAPTGGDEAFLDASAIAAQGNQTYDIKPYSALPLAKSCFIKIEGDAPGASLVGLNVFGSNETVFDSVFLQAIDYAVTTDHVNVLNESLGSNLYPDDGPGLDAVKKANDQAVAAGVTVTASSGDAGITNTIGAPSTDPKVVGVGASTTYEWAYQNGYGGSQFGVTGWDDDNISALSSSGFDQAGNTISLVAPGELNWALCTPDPTRYTECTTFTGKPSPIEESGGTSESAPVTAGVAALVIQGYEKTHDGAAPTPAVVKQILTSTADDISAPAELQGAGRVDAYRAVLAAEAYPGGTGAVGSPATLLTSKGQLAATGAPGTAETFTEKVTNVGASPTTVTAASRQLGAYSPIKGATVTLSASSPHSVDYQGYDDDYETVPFTVPSGVDRLNGSIAYQAASSALSARVRLALIDPSGKLADYSLPQGIGNYGTAQVANPVPGHWTAYIWSRPTSGGGTTGPVKFAASVARYGSFGTVTPAAKVLAPGASTTVSLGVSLPSTPGDTAGSIVLSQSGQPAVTVPVTLRTLVPAGSTSFGGVLTGGNGRSVVTGVSEYYQVDVPAGRPELNAAVTLKSDPSNGAFIWLIDPAGELEAFQSNVLVTQDSSGALSATRELGADVHVPTPVAGRWTVIVLFAPTVSGTAISVPYTVAVDQTAPTVTATGVPKGATLTGSRPARVTIKVTNTGTAPEAYFVDGRTTATTAYPLTALNGASTTVPNSPSSNLPTYLVPSGTTKIVSTAKTTGSTPIIFDEAGPTGDPDVASGHGSSVSRTFSAAPVPAGVWDVAPNAYGTFGPAAATETATTTMTATTLAFDGAVSSDTGDLWLASLGGPVTASPVVVQPGKTAIIPVTIAPRGPSGSTVSGNLYLDDDSLYYYAGGVAPDGNTVTAIPYSYTVG